MSLHLLKSTTVVGGMTLISRVLGFVRDMVTAHVFGASAGIDAFVIASKIPNFLRRLFAEGAFSQAFVPLLAKYRLENQKENQQLPAQQDELQTFINRVCGNLSLVLVGVTGLGMLLAPLFILLFAPGFASHNAVVEAGRFELAASMLRITFPYLLFISLTAFAGGILNTFGKFAVPAFTPVFLNIAMIFSALWLAPLLAEPVMALAWGIFFGGLVQLLFQIPFLKQIGRLPKLEINWRDTRVRKILTLMVPALLGVSVNQLNLMLGSIFASFLPVGSVTWLYYAERLMEFPLGGFAVALTTVVLPRLSAHHAADNRQHFSSTLDWGIRWILLIGTPAALGLGLLAGPLLSTLFQSGRFTAADVLMSQSCLIAYALGILGFMLVKIFGAAFYAKQDIKSPVRYAIVTVIANAGLSILCMQWLAASGLALATGLSALLNAGLLGWGLYRRKMFELQAGWGGFLFRLLLALAALSFFILYFTPPLEAWFVETAYRRVLNLAALVGGGFLVYLGALIILGLRPRHVLVKEVVSE